MHGQMKVMKKLVALITILVFGALGLVQAGATTLHDVCPECTKIVQMDCCADGAMKMHQPASQPMQKRHRLPTPDCDTNLCLVPAQPPAVIFDRSQDQPELSVSLPWHHFHDSHPPAWLEEEHPPPEKAGPPVPLYTLYCVLLH